MKNDAFVVYRIDDVEAVYVSTYEQLCTLDRELLNSVDHFTQCTTLKEACDLARKKADELNYVAYDHCLKRYLFTNAYLTHVRGRKG